MTSLFKKLMAKPAMIFASVTILVSVIIVVIQTSGLLQSLDLILYDQFVKLRAQVTETSKRVAVIGIREKALNQYGWPLSDDILAQALEALLHVGARTIAVDLYRATPTPPGSDRLNALLKSSERIIWVSKFGDRDWQGVPPPQIMRDADRYGFADMVLDPGGVIRRGLLFLDDGASQTPSLSFRSTVQYLKANDIFAEPDPTTPDHLRFGEVTLPPLNAGVGAYVDADVAGYQFLIDYKEGAGAFPVSSLIDLLEGHLKPGAVQDKIVFIGVTAESVKDFFQSPANNENESPKATYGVLLHAFMANQLLRHALDGDPTASFLTNWQEILLIIVGAICGGGVAMMQRAARFLYLTMAAGGVVVIGAGYGALLLDYWVPSVGILLSYLMTGAIVTSLLFQREGELRRAFSSYISANLLDHVVADPSSVKLSGDRRFMTFVFTDIEGFTALSETVDPEFLIPLLNEYLSVMCGVVHKHNGTIDKLVGDAIVFFFNAPVDQPDHAQRAVTCAIELQGAAQEFSAHQAERGVLFGRTRIGVHSGMATVGNFGGDAIFDYTAYGDAVNTTARLEHANKYLGTEICVSGETVKLCLDLQFRPVGAIVVRGRSNSVDVFSLVTSEQAESELSHAYDHAYQLLQNHDKEAMAAFLRLQKAYPQDPLVDLHMRRLSNGESGATIVEGESCVTL